MTDLISKQAAINTTYNMCCRWDGEDRDDLRNMMLTAFQELPTIDPVKHGKWLKHPGDIVSDDGLWGETLYDCSECGHTRHVATEFCSKCGAKMEQDGEIQVRWKLEVIE